MISLTRKVLDRKNYLTSLIPQIEDLMRKYGTVTKEEEHSCHYVLRRELDGFANFAFSTYGAFSMYGGDNVKVFYRGTLVLDVDYWNITDPHVTVFNTETNWRPALNRVLKNRDTIAARLERERKAAHDRTVREVNRKKVQDQLQQEAEKLGIQ